MFARIFYGVLIFSFSCNTRVPVERGGKKAGDTPSDQTEDQPAARVGSLGRIGNYAVFKKALKGRPDKVTLRRFTDIDSQIEYALVVDVNTLKTTLYPLGDLDTTAVEDNLRKSNYYRKLEALSRQELPASGITTTAGEGYSLTIDLCPSTKKFNQDFLDFLASSGTAPVYLCISGKWIEKHASELEYIQKKKGKDILWVNHSYSHYYDPEKKLDENFMLSPATDFDLEVLGNEKLMIERGLIPTPFFRFPGLNSNPELCKKLVAVGLIPLSSDAWMAKGQQPRKGSIILLHMNGNEPEGLSLFRKFHDETKLRPVEIH